MRFTLPILFVTECVECNVTCYIDYEIEIWSCQIFIWYLLENLISVKIYENWYINKIKIHFVYIASMKDAHKMQPSRQKKNTLLSAMYKMKCSAIWDKNK